MDAEYRFGRPKLYLTPHEVARFTIMRSRLGDTRLERQAAAAGGLTSRRPELRSEISAGSGLEHQQV